MDIIQKITVERFCGRNSLDKARQTRHHATSHKAHAHLFASLIPISKSQREWGLGTRPLRERVLGMRLGAAKVMAAGVN